jgi:hypothetical protein
MSHSILFSRFKDGESIQFDLDALKEILRKHGCEIDRPIAGGYMPVFFPMDGDDGTIGGDEGGISVEEGAAIEFAIGHPFYDEPMKKLAFDLIDKLGLCAYPDFGESIYATVSCEQDIPEELLESCESGLTVVTTPDQLW